MRTSAHTEERLSNAAALAVLSSDALSSVAYATEEILLVLVAAGSSVLRLSLPIAVAIILLLAIVVLSYRQIMGLYQQAVGQNPQNYPVIPAVEPPSFFFILRAFSAGCTALTGVEAISSGVLAFKQPEWKNARITLLYLGVILGIMFIGITYLARVYHIVPEEGQTVVSLLGRQILGSGPLYYFVQIATLSILILAANTSYADFPRLSSLLARDGFLPRQLALLGDRLVYSNGIILLSLGAAMLIIIFRGEVNAVIPLYAVGVFTSFTLSQAGMICHWFKKRTPGWRSGALINGLGAITEAVVLAVLVTTKFLGGAWLAVVAIPLVVSLFLAILVLQTDETKSNKNGDS